MRKLLAMLAAVFAASMIAGLAATATATPAQAACSRSISTSGNSYSVVITLHQTCGRPYRAILFAGGGTGAGYHYGTYHVWPGGNADQLDRVDPGVHRGELRPARADAERGRLGQPDG